MFQNTFYYVMSNVEVMVHKCGSDGATNVDDRVTDSYAYVTNHPCSTGLIHCITGAPNGTNVRLPHFSISTSSGMMKRMWTRVEEVRTVAFPKAL